MMSVKTCTTLFSGITVMKLFFFATDKEEKKVKMSQKPLPLGLIFTKGPIVPERYSRQIGSGHSHKNWTGLEKVSVF
jgi:hypothetical protein